MEIKKKQGFATLDPTERTRISSMGGKKAQKLGTAHKFSKEEAIEAGRKGGLARAKNQLNKHHES